MFTKKRNNPYSYLMFYTTLHCNMNCPKCMRKVYKLELKSPATWSEFIYAMDSWTNQIKPETLCFTGGEPTFWSFLKSAILVAKEKYKIPEVIVATNGLFRNAEDYGIADKIRISNYGSINRMDIFRLKKQLGKRFGVINSIQLMQPLDEDENAIPADCSCTQIHVIKNKFWPCGGSVGRMPGFSGGDYIDEFLEMDLYNQNICKNCYGNKKVRNKYHPKFAAEISVWNKRTFILG